MTVALCKCVCVCVCVCVCTVEGWDVQLCVCVRVSHLNSGQVLTFNLYRTEQEDHEVLLW